MLEKMVNYKPFLLRIAKSNLTAKNQMWAEDIVQETFLKAVNSFSQFNGNAGKLSTWLATITKNACIDFNRKKVNMEERMDTPAFFALVNEEQKQAVPINVRFYLRLLSKQDQKLLRLKYFFKLSHNEIGALCGIPPQNISMLTSRARERFHAILIRNGIHKTTLFDKF